MPGTPKYLNVVYTCVPKRILKEIKRNREDSSPTSNYFCDPDGNRYLGNGDEHGNHGGDHGNGGTSNGDPDVNGDPNGWPGIDDGGLDGEAGYVPEPSTYNYNNILTPTTTTPHIEGGIVCDPSLPEYDQPSECLTPKPAPSSEKDDYIGFLHDWVNTTQFIKIVVVDNMEKFILYLVLSIMAGIILILLVIIFRLVSTKRKTKRSAKLDISEPVPNSTRQTEDFSLLTDNSNDTNGIEILSINHSRPPPFPTDSLSRHGTNSRPPPFPTDTNTFRSDTATRSLNNYYG